MAVKRIIGLMSGTSLDGIDAALLTLTDGAISAMGPWLTVPYDDAQRQRLRSVLGGQGPVQEVEQELTTAHAGAVAALRDLLPPDCPVDVIGFHGQTILHQPDQRRTWQIGDGALLARLTQIPVVCDFRSQDVAAGGQGAPLVPVFHNALAAGLPRPLAVLNLGGVGNVTWIGSDGHLLAFDTGPGNALLDDWMWQHTGQSCDRDGARALAGQVDRAMVERFLSDEYFRLPPPKSLDRDHFQNLAKTCLSGLSLDDGAASLVACTAHSVAAAAQHFPAPARQWLVCGGGRHNPAIMAALNNVLSAPVEPVERVGWNGDALEALAFAYLAHLHQMGLPQSFPGTTGCPQPMTGGVLYLPDDHPLP